MKLRDNLALWLEAVRMVESAAREEDSPECIAGRILDAVDRALTATGPAPTHECPGLRGRYDSEMHCEGCRGDAIPFRAATGPGSGAPAEETEPDPT